MAIIPILQYPDARLKRQGELVQVFDESVQKIIDDMFETHYHTKNCAALAATQLDFAQPKHITVIDFSNSKDKPLCLVNAKIVAVEGEIYEEEGCMSVPGGIYEKVKRAAKIKVVACDRYGKPLEFEADGFMAKCIQHELDHLQGKIFIDHVSSLKRKRIEKKIEKFYRSNDHDHRFCNHDPD